MKNLETIKITGRENLIREFLADLSYWYPEESDNIAFFLENLNSNHTLYCLENGRYYSDGDTIITKVDENLVEFDLDQIFTLTLRKETYILAPQEAII